MLLLYILQFLVGVVLLCVGADWLVRGATILAERLHVPKSVAGLTMVAIGTSAPEFVVNVLAAMTGNTEFALPNVSGSNMANICLGLGLCGFAGGIAIRRIDFGVDVVFSFLTIVIVLTMTLFSAKHELPLLAIAPLTCALLWYCRSLTRRGIDATELEADANDSPWKGLGTFLTGGVGLYLGGNLVLMSTVATAEALHVGKDIIALTVIAIGTSVPDITATIVAARRGENSIAVGNILGSNISNVVLVLNASLMASRGGIATTTEVRLDYVFVAAITLFLCSLVFAKQHVSRRNGALLILSYVAYLAYRLLTL